MEHSILVNRHSEGDVASIFPKKFLQYIPVLLTCISLQYSNTGTNLLIDNAAAWHAFVVALLFAGMASCKLKLASRNRSELPITSNDITPPISNTTCIFLISGFLALFCLLYVLHPLHACLGLCLALFLFNKIPHISYYYQKAIEWFALGGISNRVFNLLPASFQQIFRRPQQVEAAPQAFNDTPSTAV